LRRCSTGSGRSAKAGPAMAAQSATPEPTQVKNETTRATMHSKRLTMGAPEPTFQRQNTSQTQASWNHGGKASRPLLGGKFYISVLCDLFVCLVRISLSATRRHLAAHRRLRAPPTRSVSARSPRASAARQRRRARDSVLVWTAARRAKPVSAANPGSRPHRGKRRGPRFGLF